jgi:precorrin-6B methylase 2
MIRKFVRYACINHKCTREISLRNYSTTAVNAPITKILSYQSSQFNSAVIVSQRGEWRLLSFGDVPEITLLQGKLRVFKNEELDFTGRCSYINTMVSAAIVFSCYLKSTITLPHDLKILSIGLGVGSIPTFFTRHFPKVHIHAVDIDPQVIEAAEKFFGLDVNHVKISCRDAKEYIHSLSSGEYGIIFLDVFGPDGIPANLVTLDFVKQLSSIVSETDVVIANIHGDIKMLNEIIESFKSQFTSIHLLDAYGESNTILIAYNSFPASMRQILDQCESIEKKHVFDFDFGGNLVFSLHAGKF